MRRDERGDGDQDQEVEQHRPAGDEAPQLVERVAREDRRPGALLVQRRALDVRHRSQDEEDPGAEEDDGRQAEGVLCDDADREVDRGRQRRPDDREQRRRPEAAADHPIPRQVKYSRPAPAATNSTPSTVPIASGPPPAPSVRTRIASPITTIAADSSIVEPR